MARDLAGWLRSIVIPTVEVPHDANWRPSTDIYRTAKGWLIKLELAGVRPEDVRATVAGRRVHVQGVRRDSGLTEGCRCYRLEIAYSRFERDIELPSELDTTHVEAEYCDGMMLIRLQSGD